MTPSLWQKVKRNWRASWRMWKRRVKKLAENSTFKKQITSLGSIQDTGYLALVHWDDPERWYGERGGRGVQDWELMYTHGRFVSMHGKNQYSIVKQNKVKIKIKTIIFFKKENKFPGIHRRGHSGTFLMTVIQKVFDKHCLLDSQRPTALAEACAWK